MGGHSARHTGKVRRIMDVVQGATILTMVGLACDCSANVVNRKMKRGIRSLAVIACTAPFLGILGMLSATPSVLKALTYRGYGDIAAAPSELFVLPAAGLLLASVATVFHRVLSARVEHFHVEMKSATLQLMNDLVRPSTNI